MTGQLFAFAAASLVVIVVPGPDMMLMLRNTVRAGRVGAVWTAAGILTGLAVLATAAALGITALLTASPTLFQIVRVAGGCYLLYLGVQALRSYLRLRRQQRTSPTAQNPAAAPSTPPAPHKTPTDGTQPAHPSRARRTALRQGLLCNLLNPKVAAFYLSLFPQFDLAPLAPLVQHIALAAMFWGLCLLWYIGLVAAIGRLERRLQSPAFARRTEAIAGLALTGLGAFVIAGSS